MAEIAEHDCVRSKKMLALRNAIVETSMLAGNAIVFYSIMKTNSSSDCKNCET